MTNSTVLAQPKLEFLELRDIVGFSSEYLLQAFKELEDETVKQIIATLCDNLKRAQSCLEKEISKQEQEISGTAYDSNHFSNVNFLDVDLGSVVEEFTLDNVAINNIVVEIDRTH